MEGRSRTCPECNLDITPTVAAPTAPSYFVRAPERGPWSYSPDSPAEGERFGIAYRCPRCGKTFRVVSAPD